PPAGEPAQELAHHGRPPPGLVGDQPDELEEAPLVESLDLDPTEDASSAPHRVDPEAHLLCPESRDLPLEEHLGRLRESREKVGDLGSFGAQIRATVDRRPAGRKDTFEETSPRLFFSRPFPGRMMLSTV